MQPTLIEESFDESQLCLVCDSRLCVASSLNVFYTHLPRNGELLANFVLRALRPAVGVLRSSHLCVRCYDLFMSLEQAQWTVASVKRQILNVYCAKDVDKISEENIVSTYGSNEISPKNEIFVEANECDEIDESRLFDSNRVGNIPLSGDTTVENLTTVIPDFRGPEIQINASSIVDEKPEIDNLNNVDQTIFDSDYSDKIDPIKPEMIDEKATCNNERVSTVNATQNSAVDEVPAKILEIEKYPDKNVVSSCEINENTANTGKQDDGGSWINGKISKYSQKPLKYACTICDKQWRTSAELKTHVKSHSNVRPYMCEKCGQAYKHKHALEIHVGMHNGTSPFRCNVCDKCFTQKGALMRHLPMHTGETPYQCELCGKRFVHHTSYNMHALSHTGKKSYQCHVCDLSLLSTSHLKRHMRVHTGEKPYSCSLCGKSFAERYNLFAHQKIHDPTEIMAKAAKKMAFKCERCDEHFDKKQKLEDHAREHKKNDTTNGNKWLGHTIDVVLRENVKSSKINDNTIEQTWREIDYGKLTNSQLGLCAAQSDNVISQITHESMTKLMSNVSHNRGLAVIIQSEISGNVTEIDRSQT